MVIDIVYRRNSEGADQSFALNKCQHDDHF
jgi:hypothetical protein